MLSLQQALITLPAKFQRDSEMNPPSTSTTVLDANAPWVRSLFQAMPPTIDVNAVEVNDLRTVIRKARAAPLQTVRRSRTRPHYRTRRIVVPGLRRFRWSSSRLVRHALSSSRQDVLVLTNPWHVHAFENLSARLKLYYPSDAFAYYVWPFLPTYAREQVALDTADVVLAMSVQQCEDFRRRTLTPVIHFPNAVAREFMETLSDELVPAADLDIGSFDTVVGCVGNINDTYDWQLIDGLVAEFPDVLFVFVGPITAANVEDPERIHRSLEKPNVRWIGERSHELLPGYLTSFDICLNPLEKNEHNDRRCPLRLYDYMATTSVILSTNVREAEEFGNEVHIAPDVARACDLVRQARAGQLAPDLIARRDWLNHNTWDARAQEFSVIVQQRIGM